MGIPVSVLKGFERPLAYASTWLAFLLCNHFWLARIDLALTEHLSTKIKYYSAKSTLSINELIENNLELESKFEKMEGSIAFRVNNNNNSRCLIINSDFGNIPENLSHTFEQVWSFEENSDKTLIQNTDLRIKKSKILL